MFCSNISIPPIYSVFSNSFSAVSTFMPTTFMPIFSSFSRAPISPSIGSNFNWFPSFNFSSFIPNFSFSLPSFSSITSSVSRAVSSTISGGQKVSVSSANQNSSFGQSLGYKAEKGLKLAKDAASHVVGFVGRCATYVKNAISRCGLGAYTSGHGYQMADVLKNNKNFKQISPEGVDLKKLPAGCVLVFGRGKSGYSSSYGHTEITTGTGKAVSDGITNNLRKPSAIFIPV